MGHDVYRIQLPKKDDLELKVGDLILVESRINNSHLPFDLSLGIFQKIEPSSERGILYFRPPAYALSIKKISEQLFPNVEILERIWVRLVLVEGIYVSSNAIGDFLEGNDVFSVFSVPARKMQSHYPPGQSLNI